MRNFKKSERIPASLIGKEPPSSPDEINTSIYKADDVVETLTHDQHNKCAYCECSLCGTYKDVEHYRPKKEFKSNTGTGTGYYWLAYDWDNLLYSCNKCNRTYKKTYFDLEDENQRNIEGKDVSRERPLLLNPTKDNVSEYIEFDTYIAKPRVSSGLKRKRAEYTINLLKLNEREELLQERRETWEKHDTCIKSILTATRGIEISKDEYSREMFRQLLEQQTKLKEKLESETSVYSGMFI